MSSSLDDGLTTGDGQLVGRNVFTGESEEIRIAPVSAEEADEMAAFVEAHRQFECQRIRSLTRRAYTPRPIHRCGARQRQPRAAGARRRGSRRGAATRAGPDEPDGEPEPPRGRRLLHSLGRSAAAGEAMPLKAL
jgi:hypothetical protein